jgi:hypothetical protein
MQRLSCKVFILGGGYEHPIEVGGAVFTPIVLSPYAYAYAYKISTAAAAGTWHGGCGNETASASE